MNVQENLSELCHRALDNDPVKRNEVLANSLTYLLCDILAEHRRHDWKLVEFYDRLQGGSGFRNRKMKRDLEA